MAALTLGLVEFEKCTILSVPILAPVHRLGLVEFEKCTIFLSLCFICNL